MIPCGAKKKPAGRRFRFSTRAWSRPTVKRWLKFSRGAYVAVPPMISRSM
jgi:hypothetical protein